jgi:hypothetical protein
MRKGTTARAREEYFFMITTLSDRERANVREAFTRTGEGVKTNFAGIAFLVMYILDIKPSQGQLRGNCRTRQN